MFIAIDFDGTCVTDEYPKVGNDIGAASILLRLVNKGNKLILFTIRSGKELSDAEVWFQAYGIPLFGINRNPVQWRFSRSPKVFAHLYIDDSAVGCPLKIDKTLSEKPFVDWEKIESILESKGIL